MRYTEIENKRHFVRSLLYPAVDEAFSTPLGRIKSLNYEVYEGDHEFISVCTDTPQLDFMIDVTALSSAEIGKTVFTVLLQKFR